MEILAGEKMTHCSVSTSHQASVANGIYGLAQDVTAASWGGPNLPPAKGTGGQYNILDWCLWWSAVSLHFVVDPYSFCLSSLLKGLSILYHCEVNLSEVNQLQFRLCHCPLHFFVKYFVSRLCLSISIPSICLLVLHCILKIYLKLINLNFCR